MSDSTKNNKIPPILLKKINGVETLKAEQLNEILGKSAYWIKNFKTLSAGDRKVTCNFSIEHFSYNGIFDLSTAEDIIERGFDVSGEVPYLFLSDLISFVEQIRTSLSNGHGIIITSDQRVELDRLGDTFFWFGVSPNNDKIKIDDLQRLENIQLTERIIQRIDLIHLILAPTIGISTDEMVEEPDETLDSQRVVGGGGGNFSIFWKSKQTEDEGDKDRGDPNKAHQQPSHKQNGQKSSSDFLVASTPLKLSELDPQSKLYLQSLSIITINQALSRYFSEASLQKIGLPAGTRVTFDQLPLKVRQQLMDQAFLQVETLLLTGGVSAGMGGGFSLDGLIKNSSDRINFSNQAALNLLMDVRGLQLLNGAVREIASNTQTIKTNEQNRLTDHDLSERSQSGDGHTVTTDFANDFLVQRQNDADFAKIFESKLNVFRDEKQLNIAFLNELSEITKFDNTTNIRITANISSIIELMIQQGLPPEYLIPNADNFDYSRFRNIFGNDIDAKQFDRHKKEIANLVVSYWKRKRAIWIRDIRQEFGFERMSPEEAQRVYADIVKNPQKAEFFRLLATTSNFDGQGSQEASSVTDGFNATQQNLIKSILQQQLEAMSDTEQQKSLQVYFDFYAPGATIVSVGVFMETIVPQINPMDFYMLQANQALGDGAFARGGNGWAQQAFTQGADYNGTGFMDSALAKQGTALAAQAIGNGLYAVPGLGEALLSIEAAAPWFKKLKEEAIKMGLEELLAWLEKNWPILVAPLLVSLVPLLMALGSVIGGINNFMAGAAKLINQLSGNLQASAGGKALAIPSKSALGQGLGRAEAPASLKLATKQVASSAMVTAGQAVIATIAVTGTIYYFNHVSLNSAFLTDFPKNETELNGNTDTEQTSKYAEVKKTANIIGGCPSPENDGAKCKTPSFPISIEYTIVIKPKEDFALQITNIKDVTKFRQSKKGWEEAGQSPPSITTERVLEGSYFAELIKKQGTFEGQSPFTAVPTPITGPNEEGEVPVTLPPAEPTSGTIVIPAGGSLSFKYTLDNLGPEYNHLAITNSIEVDFIYQNANISGNDKVITASRVCLGNCSAGAGCWPTSGKIWQLPFGEGSAESTHRPPGAGGWGDSYDIGCSNCSGAAIYGPPVFANFDGNLCFKGCDNNQYGCRYILEFQNDGQKMYEDFAHFQEPNPALSTAGSCMQVEAGFMIGKMSNRGIGDVHLHFGLVADAGGGWWGSKPASSITETLVPETNAGNYPPKLGDFVTSCYE